MPEGNRFIVNCSRVRGGASASPTQYSSCRRRYRIRIVSHQCRQGQAANNGAISGVVQGPQGPEGGVWVIAETNELPTKMIKIVVTDDQGRFVMPELPTASYSVWVRGYGLVDSKPVTLKPDATGVKLKAAARTPQEAAKIYPGRLLAVAARGAGEDRVPGHRSQGQRSRARHAHAEQLGLPAQIGLQLLPPARERADPSVDHVMKAKPEIKAHQEAWEWRLGTGVRGNGMYGTATGMGMPRTPERPRGLDGARRQGRGAAGAAPADRGGAQRRGHVVGLGHG